MKLPSIVAILLTACTLLAAPVRAAGDDRQQLELAASRFRTGHYEDAAELFAGLLSRSLDPKQGGDEERLEAFREARPLYAACLVGLGRGAEAEAVILAHLRDNPFYELTPGQFPQPVADRFIAVRAEHRGELEQIKNRILEQRQRDIAAKAAARQRAGDRIARLKELARREVHVVERSRWVAMLPFGAGQFQNGDTGLGVLFASSQALAIGTSVVSGAVAIDQLQIDCQAEGLNCDEFGTRFDAIRTVNWISFGASAALVVAGIIEAQVSFEERSEIIKERDLPVDLELEPEVSTTDTGGVFIGLRGRF